MNTATFPLSSPDAAQVSTQSAVAPSMTGSLHGMRRWLRWAAVSVAIVALAGAGGFTVGLVSALMR